MYLYAFCRDSGFRLLNEEFQYSAKVSLAYKIFSGRQNLWPVFVCLFVTSLFLWVTQQSRDRNIMTCSKIGQYLCGYAPIIACYGFVDIAREVLTSRHSLKICVKLDTLIHMGYDRECPKNLSYIMKHYHWFHTINLDIQSVTYSNLCRRPVRHPPVK